MKAVNPAELLPSQDFLKEGTVRYILDCIEKGETDQLPPPPIVRKNNRGDLVAIDGHNLIAVRLFLGQDVDVIVVDSPHAQLPGSGEGVEARQNDLQDKFESSLVEQSRVSDNGVASFQDLIAKYPDLLS